jgi:hypothetical protein
MWAAQYYKFDKPRRWINSGGLGTMGFGLPAAMGVQLAHPGSPVACVTGEASIQMNIQELATCKQFRLPIKVVMLNNRYLGMVRQWQEIFHGNRYSESYMDSLPDFARWPRLTATSASAWTSRATWKARCARPSRARTIWSSSTSRWIRPRTSIRWSRAARAHRHDPVGRRSLIGRRPAAQLAAALRSAGSTPAAGHPAQNEYETRHLPCHRE